MADRSRVASGHDDHGFGRPSCISSVMQLQCELPHHQAGGLNAVPGRVEVHPLGVVGEPVPVRLPAVGLAADQRHTGTPAQACQAVGEPGDGEGPGQLVPTPRRAPCTARPATVGTQGQTGERDLTLEEVRGPESEAVQVEERRGQGGDRGAVAVGPRRGAGAPVSSQPVNSKQLDACFRPT